MGQSVRTIEDERGVVGDCAGGGERAGSAAVADLECASVDCGCAGIGVRAVEGNSSRTSCADRQRARSSDGGVDGYISAVCYSDNIICGIT